MNITSWLNKVSIQYYGDLHLHLPAGDSPCVSPPAVWGWGRGCGPWWGAGREGPASPRWTTPHCRAYSCCPSLPPPSTLVTVNKMLTLIINRLHIGWFILLKSLSWICDFFSNNNLETRRMGGRLLWQRLWPLNPKCIGVVISDLPQCMNFLCTDFFCLDMERRFDREIIYRKCRMFNYKPYSYNILLTSPFRVGTQKNETKALNNFPLISL